MSPPPSESTTKEETTPLTLITLPSELLEKILSFLPLPDLLKVGEVSCVSKFHSPSLHNL